MSRSFSIEELSEGNQEDMGLKRGVSYLFILALCTQDKARTEAMVCFGRLE